VTTVSKQVRISVYVDQADEAHARRYIENALTAIPHELTVGSEPEDRPPEHVGQFYRSDT
jgi:hypothetical protein